MKITTVLAVAALIFSVGCNNKNNEENINYSTTDEELVNENEVPADGTAVDTGADTVAGDAAAPNIPAYTSDSMFVSMATSSGIKEVQLGEIAAKSGNSEDVKKFGQQMVTGHTKANTELKEIARKKNWFPMQRMMPGEKADYNRISKLTGAEFDKAYMQQMVADHQKAIGLFESAANSATDADLKAFANKTLPALRMHLDMAQNLNATMNKM